MSDQQSNIIFVGEVEKHECLYNFRLPQYSRKDLTEKAWQEVGDKVSMSAAECKVKWRNLRTVFMRKMKPPTSGSGTNRKTYYLADAMQFCLPFMKTMGPPSIGNLPPETHEGIVDKKTQDDNESSVFAEDSKDFVQSQAAPPSPNPPERERTVLRKHNTGPVQSSSSGGNRNIMQRNKSAVDTDNCVSEYIKAKKMRLDATVNESSLSKTDKKEALKMFLLSLIPELDEFSDYQIKIFKRRVFTVIDEISNSTESRFQPALYSTLPSPYSNTSRTSPSSLSPDCILESCN